VFIGLNDAGGSQDDSSKWEIRVVVSFSKIPIELFASKDLREASVMLQKWLMEIQYLLRTTACRGGNRPFC
jgi:hypothetical protein